MKGTRFDSSRYTRLKKPKLIRLFRESVSPGPIMKRDVLYQGKILNLVKLDDRWEIVEHVPAVCILALRGTEVLGVSQFRPALSADTWELPAGLIDVEETPEQAAARELAEETQLGGELRLITQLHSSPGFCTEKVYIFEASKLRPAYAPPDDGEKLTIVWRDLAQTWQDIKEGKLFSSSHTTLALCYALGRMGKLT